MGLGSSVTSSGAWRQEEGIHFDILGSDGTIDTTAPMIRCSFQATIVSHTEPMLVSKWQHQLTDDRWSFEGHAVSEGRDSWFEKNWSFTIPPDA